MLGHAGGLGWDELALFGVVAVVLGVVFLRSRRAGQEEGGEADAATRAAGLPEGRGSRACPYCGSPAAEGRRRCGACGFSLEGGGEER